MSYTNASKAGLGDPYWYEWSVGLNYIIDMINPDSDIDYVELQADVSLGLDDVVVTYKNGMLITNADGTPLTIQGSKRLWDSYVTCMERAINGCSKRWYGKRKQDRDKELPEWQPFTVKPYDLRHSFITWGRDNGVELHTMIEWCGHSDAQMILKIYDEVTSERSNAEAAKLIKVAFGKKSAHRKKR